MRPGDICERNDRPGHYVAVISAPVLAGYVMAVQVAVSAEYAAGGPSPLHTIGTAVQGYLIPSNQANFRTSDLRPALDRVEDAPLRACRSLFQAAIADR